MLEPSREEGDMYISFWLKLQPDLLEKMTPQNWRAVFEWKTGGDYRLIVMRELGKRVSWRHGKAWQSRCRWSIAGRRSSWKISARDGADGDVAQQLREIRGQRIELGEIEATQTMRRTAVG